LVGGGGGGSGWDWDFPVFGTGPETSKETTGFTPARGGAPGKKRGRYLYFFLGRREGGFPPRGARTVRGRGGTTGGGGKETGRGGGTQAAGADPPFQLSSNFGFRGVRGLFSCGTDGKTRIGFFGGILLYVALGTSKGDREPTRRTEGGCCAVRRRCADGGCRQRVALAGGNNGTRGGDGALRGCTGNSPVGRVGW